MKFNSRKEQIEYVIGRLIGFISSFLEESEKAQILEIPNSCFGLIALEIGKMEGLEHATFDEAVGTVQSLFPSYYDVIENAAEKMTLEDRTRMERFVRTLSELLKP